MADGWRNRYMAPFYALAISFVLVLLLGLALDAPAEPKSTPKPLAPKAVASAIQFSAEAGDEFPVTNVIVLWGKEKHAVTTAEELRDLKPTEAVFACATMRPGWEAVGAEEMAGTGYVCWGPLKPAKPGAPITLDVKARE